MSLVNCALFNAFRLYVEFNGNIIGYKKLLHVVLRLWIEEYSSIQNVSNDVESISALLPISRTSKFDYPRKLLGDTKKHNVTLIIGSGNKNRYVRCPCKVCSAMKKRSESSSMCALCLEPLTSWFLVGLIFRAFAVVTNNVIESGSWDRGATGSALPVFVPPKVSSLVPRAS